MSQVQLSVCLGEGESSAMDDEGRLVERAKQDRRAFAELYRRHRRVVAPSGFRRTGDPHVTEDVLSEVFLAALRTLPRYRYRGVPVRVWLFRIATNAVNRWARRQRRWPTDSLDTVAVAERAAPGGSTPGLGESERARQALLSIAPKYQAILSLHYIEGLSVEEVATVIGCRVGTVKSRLGRGRQALRRQLQTRR
ncbi:MAG: RNA polymerase sigma factor [bacterium]|nr:RNA polymerase sigma factor [bacterium]